MAHMARPLAFGLAAVVSVFRKEHGCTSTSGTHADAAATGDAETIDAGRCVNGGGLASDYDRHVVPTPIALQLTT
jgi:hypothetical protein